MFTTVRNESVNSHRRPREIELKKKDVTSNKFAHPFFPFFPFFQKNCTATMKMARRMNFPPRFSARLGTHQCRNNGKQNSVPLPPSLSLSHSPFSLLFVFRPPRYYALNGGKTLKDLRGERMKVRRIILRNGQVSSRYSAGSIINR